VTPANYTWRLFRGGSVTKRFTFTDDTGTAVNISAITWRMDLRESYEASVVALALSTGTGIASGGSGIIDVTITKEQSALLTADAYVAELAAESAGQRQYWLKIRFEVEPVATR
jgi:hypothetical protein